MTSSLLRQDVLPVGVGYLLIMGALATGLRLLRRDAGEGTARRRGGAGMTGTPGTPEIPGTPGARGMTGPPAAGWVRLARRYAGTALGGYLLLMAVVILYYYGVARVGGAFIASAFTGCALLIGLTTPVFALASWLDGRHRARPGRKAGG
jgi:Family of unknown function (DUF6256)